MASTCIGGCGKELPPKNKTGYAWGHSKGCPSSELPPPRTPETNPDSETQSSDEAQPQIECLLTESQLDRIWEMLPAPEKALAILTALNALRE